MRLPFVHRLSLPLGERYCVALSIPHIACSQLPSDECCDPAPHQMSTQSRVGRVPRPGDPRTTLCCAVPILQVRKPGLKRIITRVQKPSLSLPQTCSSPQPHAFPGKRVCAHHSSWSKQGHGTFIGGGRSRPQPDSSSRPTSSRPRPAALLSLAQGADLGEESSLCVIPPVTSHLGGAEGRREGGRLRGTKRYKRAHMCKRRGSAGRSRRRFQREQLMVAARQ